MTMPRFTIPRVAHCASGELPVAALDGPAYRPLRVRSLTMRNYWVWSIVLGIIIVIIAVVEWFGHITLPHAVAILTGIVGLSVALGGLGSRSGTV